MITMNLPFVNIVTVNYNGKRHLQECFNSLYKLNYPKNKLEIIMADNGSDDGSIEFVRKNFSQVKIIKNKINNYCRANNLGIAKSRGEYIAILNNDTKVDENWLIELINVISKDDKIGAVGSKILLMDGRIQSAGHVEFPNYNWGDRGFLQADRQQYNQIMEVQSISNCAALYRRKALDKAGMFDEDFNMYMEDVDMAFRLRRKGWKILFVPKSIAYHRLHGSQQTEELRQFYILKNRLLFIAKHFPDKLPESLCGFGEISRLAYADFQKILISVFNKLLAYQKVNKAMKIMLGLQKSIELIDGYHQHCFMVELEKRTIGIQQQLQARDKQIATLDELIRTKDSQIQNQLTELKIRDEQSKASHDTIESTQQRLKIIDKQIATLDELIRTRDKQIATLDELIRTRDKQIATLDELIRTKDSQIQNQLTELQIRDEQIRDKNRIIAEKTDEILKIYNSKTYRLIVKPIIWPCFSFAKKVKKIFSALCHPSSFLLGNRPLKHKDTGICVASLYAKNAMAKHMKDNEYFIKIINNQYTQEKVILVIDIWPYHNSYHPQRHFANFSIELTINPINSKFIKMIYNWDKNLGFFVNNHEVELKDFWRGEMKSLELYLVFAYIRNLEGKMIGNRTSILQRLD